MSFSSALFLVLACWPLFGNHLTRRGHIQAAKSEQQQAWLERSAKARTFSQIGTSFLYKQEVLLFGLRDWVLDNWEKYRIQSQELNPMQANNQLVHLLTMTQIPFNVVKDITYVGPSRYNGLFILTIPIGSPWPSLLFRENYSWLSACRAKYHLQCLLPNNRSSLPDRVGRRKHPLYDCLLRAPGLGQRKGNRWPYHRIYTSYSGPRWQTRNGDRSKESDFCLSRHECPRIEECQPED